MGTVPVQKIDAFLSGGGQMGEIIRSFNWSQTSIGPPEEWPQSLLTTVSNLLRSKFPMFLWWGTDLIQFYNDAYRPSLGNEGKHPAALGQKGKDCWPEIWDVIYPLIQQVQTTGEATWHEDQLVPIFRNGKIEDVYWTFSYSAVLNDLGAFGGVLVTCTETTEKVNHLRLLAESEDQLHFAIEARDLDLLKKIEELERSNRNLEEFAYAASHDLKEPIRKIHYFADRLKISLENKFNEEDKKYFERMNAAAKRMGSLIDDLLSYSEISMQPKLFEKVDMNHVIRQVINDLELTIEEKGAKIDFNNLPVIHGHQRQVQQAFQNLLSNAIKFHKPGRHPEVHITAKKVSGRDIPLHLSSEEQQKWYHLIEVTDDGIGFEESEAEKIFNVFTRLHGNSEYKGTGIGLSIVRKVTENHHGFVKATGSPGNGASFEVYFPVIKQ